MFFNQYPNNYQYKHLPAYARFLREQHLDAFVQSQLQFSYATELPLLKLLQQYNEQQLFEFLKSTTVEFLGYLVDNRGKEQIEASMKKWESDQLQIIGKHEFHAEDITLYNYVRGKSLRSFVHLFSNDIFIALALVDELDNFLTNSTTAGLNTYLRLLQNKISQNEKELLNAQQIASIGSFEWDMVTNTATNSPEMHRIYDIGHDLMPGKFMEYIHPEDRRRVEENMEKALKDGRYEYEYRFRASGKLKHICSKGIVVYADGKPVKVRGTVQDITSRKQIEQELSEKTAELLKSNESLQRFAHVASHDLKEPLRKISLLTDQVIRKENNMSDHSRNVLQKAHNSSIRLLQMIDDIMNYSTVTHREDRTVAGLGEIVGEAIEFLEQTIEEKKATVLFNNLPEVQVNRLQMRQLIQNIIANALKFSKPGTPPVICITAEWLSRAEIEDESPVLAAKYLRVSIQDNGIGFNQKFSKQIFNLFSRLNNKAVYEGSGMGLAIAKKIIEHQGGTIQAVSKEGEGATFSFIIPQ